MRIDAYNKVNELYQATNTKKLSKTGKSSNADKLEISQVGKDYQIAKKAVQNASDIREDKVNSIKARMETGNYDFSAKEVADHLVERYFSRNA